MTQPAEHIVADVSSSLGKRRRTEEGTGSAPKGLLATQSGWDNLEVLPYSDKLWFDDGNIIIRALAKPSRAGLAPKVMSFRCHKSVLASRSPFFQSMFELPQGAEGQPAQDGLPCVDFPDDFEDVRDLLLMVYGYLDLARSESDFNYLKTISGPLKLATKYEMTDDAQRLASVLEGYWPNDYGEWVNRQRYMESQLQDPEDTREDTPEKAPTVASVNFRELAMNLTVSQELKLTKLLRAIWYDVSRFYGAAAIGTKGRTAQLDSLDEIDKTRLIVGRERLHELVRTELCAMDAYLTGVPAIFIRNSPQQRCHTRVKLLWQEAKGFGKSFDMARDPLGEFSRLRKALKPNPGDRHDDPACAHRSLVSRLHCAERRIWRKLPGIFDFEDTPDGSSELPPTPNPHHNIYEEDDYSDEHTGSEDEW